MSREKVDRYKKEKANRKQIMRKQKVLKYVRRSVVSVIAAAFVAWIAYSAYDIHESNRVREVAEVDYSAVTDYLNSINQSE